MTINKFKSLAWVMAKEHGIAANYINAETKVFSTTAFLNALQNDKDLRIAIVNKWFSGINHADWEIKNVIVDGNYLTLRLAFIGSEDTILTASENVKFMDSFQMPATVTDEMIAAGTTEGGMQNAFNTEKEPFKMNFKAYAIQSDELTDVDAAYAAMFN